MRLSFAAVLLVLLAASASAHADTLATGSVFNRDLAGVVCSHSQSSASSLSLSCGSLTPVSEGFASLTANVGDTAGSMHALVNSWEDFTHPGFTTFASTSFSLSVNGTYMLTGGTGLGLVTWTTDAFRHGEGGGGNFGPCTLNLAGVSEDCNMNAGSASGSFLVPYNTPLQLSFNTSFSGAGIDGDGVDSGMDYSFGSLIVTPEPGTFTLLSLGLLCISTWKLFASPANLAQLRLRFMR